MIKIEDKKEAEKRVKEINKILQSHYSGHIKLPDDQLQSLRSESNQLFTQIHARKN